MAGWVGFVCSIELLRDKVASFGAYPYSIPAIATLGKLEIDPRVTFFVGENGAGKSTLLEALACTRSSGSIAARSGGRCDPDPAVESRDDVAETTVGVRSILARC